MKAKKFKKTKIPVIKRRMYGSMTIIPPFCFYGLSAVHSKPLNIWSNPPLGG